MSSKTLEAVTHTHTHTHGILYCLINKGSSNKIRDS